MKNQINASNQNSQRIGQNPPKQLIWIVILIGIITFAFGSYYLSKKTLKSLGTMANWKRYNFSPTISFKIPPGTENPKYVNAGHYAVQTILPGNTTLQIWGADGASPSGGEDYFEEMKQSIASKNIFSARAINFYNTEALQFASNKPTAAQIWGGEIASKLKGVLARMDDGKALVIIHYQGQTLQENGKFETDEKTFDLILSTFEILGELKTASVLVQDGSYYGPPFDPNLYQLEITQSHYLFARSDTVNLKNYLGRKVRVHYREVKGIVMGEQQLVIVEFVE
ncbi:hypothetical protein FJZ40_04560 [Candidatus Shapirobacteria bacterium]|nr:hypothetical protein [Candidatus Shapirobacteria bacterium]